MDWLSYWLTPHDLKPWKKKIETIPRMGCPHTTTELCHFISGVNYYCDMRASHTHVLAP